MAIYTDGKRIIGDTLAGLFDYAMLIGMDLYWLRDGSRNFLHPNFPIFGNVKKRVMADMCVEKITTRKLVKLCRLFYNIPETPEQHREYEKYYGEPFTTKLDPKTEKAIEKMIMERLKKDARN